MLSFPPLSAVNRDTYAPIIIQFSSARQLLEPSFVCGYLCTAADRGSLVRVRHTYVLRPTVDSDGMLCNRSEWSRVVLDAIRCASLSTSSMAQLTGRRMNSHFARGSDDLNVHCQDDMLPMV